MYAKSSVSFSSFKNLPMTGSNLLNKSRNQRKFVLFSLKSCPFGH